MWSVENGKTILDLSSVNMSEFKITSNNGLHLIHPKKNKWDWDSEEKWLRSVVVDDNGFVVSCSWPKFGNFGEFLTDTDKLKTALAEGDIVRFTSKEDGSLCIRSVINGQVILRTRGTLFGGETDDGKETYGEKFRRVAMEKYPILLDHTWMPNVSLLLEYVAADNAIVVKYKSEDLVFLGGVNHNLSIIPWDQVVKIADDGNLRLVDIKELPNDPNKLLEEVKEWRTEGVVARCDNDQVFVKVKSAWYLANHRMKYSMTYDSIVEFCERADVLSENDLVSKLREYDYDFEVIEAAKEFYNRYVLAKEAALSKLADAKILYQNAVEKMGIILFSCEIDRRKDFAMIACAQTPVVKSMMFSLYDNKEQQINTMIKKLILLEGKKK